MPDASILVHRQTESPGVGADFTFDTPHQDKQQMFELPCSVIESGRVNPHCDHDIEPDIQSCLEKHCSIRSKNYPVDLSYVHESSVVPTRL
jgi:hypothetical protein